MEQAQKESILLQGVRDGDSGAITTLYNLFYPQLTYFALSLLNSRESAEDIAVDSFINLIHTKPEFATLQKLKSWLFTTTHHKCLDLIKQNNRHAAAHDQIEYQQHQTNDTSTDLALIRSEVLNIIYQQIEKLPPQIRQVMTLSYIEGKQVKEIAAELGTAVQTVQNQKNRGLQLLREAIAADHLLTPAFFCASLKVIGQIHHWC